MILLMLLSSRPTLASTFRVAELGKPCDSIIGQELTAGSKRAPCKDRLAFQTELFGENVTVVYLCANGSLVTENYYFPRKTLEESLADFRNVYDELNLRYGHAVLDNTPWLPEADPRWIEKDPRQYYVTWRNPELRITMTLMPRDASADSKHHLFMIIGAGDK